MFGSPIDVGDRVVVAFPLGTSATLRVGKVESFYETRQDPYWDYQSGAYIPRPSSYKVVVDWDRDFGSWGTPDKPSKVKLDSERFLKVN